MKETLRDWNINTLEQYDTRKAQLDVEAADAKRMAEFTPEDMLKELCFGSKADDVKVQPSGMPDRTAGIAVGYMTKFNEVRAKQIEPFLREHQRRARRMAHLERCIENLPGRDRELITRFFMRREKSRAIAKQIGVSRATVWRYREIALEHLIEVYQTTYHPISLQSGKHAG